MQRNVKNLTNIVLNGIITCNGVAHIDFYENRKKVGQHQHIYSCGKFPVM